MIEGDPETWEGVARSLLEATGLDATSIRASCGAPQEPSLSEAEPGASLGVVLVLLRHAEHHPGVLRVAQSAPNAYALLTYLRWTHSLTFVTMDSLGKRLRAARKAAKLTQRAVAEHFGIEASSVSRWESGSDPGLERLRELAELYGTAPGVLAFGPAPAEWSASAPSTTA